MGDIAIRVEALGKRYQIGKAERYKTLRESVVDTIKAPFRRRASREKNPDFWALKDISFEVGQGEVLGVIGRNGAGKSTLLKILSRITEPTVGRGRIFGRVGSLLEVGTGFHPELSGRENIYMNGAILGMSRAEIRGKFDQIVEFSEVGAFIDTPVKRYSSGMYMRLAFAVAAHLEPEILVVDEVLAVGDAAFQKKCLGRMGDVAQHGRTVLFVSHNMRAIQQLCQRVVWLDQGTVKMAGPTPAVTTHYLQQGATRTDEASVAEAVKSLPADAAIRLTHVGVTQDGRATTQIGNGRPVEVVFEYEVLQPTVALRVFFDVCDEDETLLFRSFNDDDLDEPQLTLPGRYVSRGTIPADLLAPTRYVLRLWATIFNIRLCTPQPIEMVLDVEPTGRVNRAYVGEPIRGKMAPRIHWENRRLD